MIQYKAAEQGIAVVLTEEAYTSKASFLDDAPLPCYGDEGTWKFLGKRIHRGLYRSSKGLIHADVNGAANIMRKVFPNVTAKSTDGIEGLDGKQYVGRVNSPGVKHPERSQVETSETPTSNEARASVSGGSIHEIKRAMDSGTSHGYLNVYGNIAIFTPFGLLLGMLGKGKPPRLAKVAICALMLSLFLEGLQAVFAIGAFDVDDMLLNTCGGVLGWMSYRLLIRIGLLFRRESDVKAESITPSEQI